MTDTWLAGLGATRRRRVPMGDHDAQNGTIQGDCMNDLIEKSAMRKIYIRLLPFAVLSYFLAYIDRINGSFAALTMRGDLDLSATVYGFAVGTFYWGYFIFEMCIRDSTRTGQGRSDNATPATTRHWRSRGNTDRNPTETNRSCKEKSRRPPARAAVPARREYCRSNPTRSRPSAATRPTHRPPTRQRSPRPLEWGRHGWKPRQDET